MAVGLRTLSLLLLFSSTAASAATVNLAWDAVTASDLAGYKVYYGTASRSYALSVKVGKSTTTAAVSGLSEGIRYYFAATAYDLSGNESPFSNEVSHLVAVKDTDGDGLSDQDETQIYGTDPTRADTDGDGLGDRDEVLVYKTDPTRDDTDGDGTPDGVEVSEGSNPLDPKSFPLANEAVFAVNAGGPQFVGADGTVYHGDTQYSGGSKYANPVAIAGTTDDPLYQTSRHGTNFSYAIPVADGDYLVTLKFAEISLSQVGQRVFDVFIEGAVVVDDLDLVAEVGPKVAYDVTVPARVTDGTLNVSFRAVVGTAKLSALVVEPAAVLFAVNAGGPQFVGADGTVYHGDTQYSGGSKYANPVAIAGTTDDPLYQTSRYGTNFSYAIPVADGDYLVTLKFAEISLSQVGQRVFDVFIEGAVVVDDLDLVAEVGPKVAYDVTVPARVTDGTLNVSFRAVVGTAKLSALVVMGREGAL